MNKLMNLVRLSKQKKKPQKRGVFIISFISKLQFIKVIINAFSSKVDDKMSKTYFKIIFHNIFFNLSKSLKEVYSNG